MHSDTQLLPRYSAKQVGEKGKQSHPRIRIEYCRGKPRKVRNDRVCIAGCANLHEAGSKVDNAHPTCRGYA